MSFLLALLALGAAGLARPPLENTTWTLSSLTLSSLSSGTQTLKPGPAMTPPTLRMVGKTVTGSTGCSPLKASVQVRGQALLFRDIDGGSTAFCTDHALGLREEFTGLLARATRYAVREGELTLHAGPARLTFRAQDARLPGLRGRYVLETVNGSPAPRTSEPVTLNITRNALNGPDGCNDDGTGDGLRGDQLHLIGLTSSTARGCLIPSAVEVLTSTRREGEAKNTGCVVWKNIRRFSVCSGIERNP